MLETAIHFLSSVPWYWVLIVAAGFTFLENIFPPSPSDTVIVFTGTLVGMGVVGFAPLLISTTIGSVLGFVVMFWLGEKFEKKIIESNKFKFLSRDAIARTENWFKKYGYWMIVANRFLSGTRAVIGFFAGMSELTASRTIILSAVSALVWNSILILLGAAFGTKWALVDEYMSHYGKIITIAGAAIILIIAVRWIVMKKKKTAVETAEKNNHANQ